MHELSIAESIVRVLDNEAKSGDFKRVKRVRLEIGALSTIVKDSLEFCFDIVAKGSVAEDAQLEILVQPASASCRGCGNAFQITEYATPCPRCDSYDVDRSSGDELRIRDMEVD